jgi:hypothetical protein
MADPVEKAIEVYYISHAKDTQSCKPTVGIPTMGL